MSELVTAFILGILLTVVVGIWLHQKVWACMNCDYDPAIEVCGEHPYCPNCGNKCKYAGRNYDLILSMIIGFFVSLTVDNENYTLGDNDE